MRIQWVFLFVFFWVLAFIFALSLLSLRTARGAECQVIKSECRRVLLNGGPATVVVCEKVQVVCE